MRRLTEGVSRVRWKIGWLGKMMIFFFFFKNQLNINSNKQLSTTQKTIIFSHQDKKLTKESRIDVTFEQYKTKTHQTTNNTIRQLLTYYAKQKASCG